MKVTYLNQWLGDQEINAIFWTLVHSLWIGLIIAVLTGVVLAFTRKATANLRYWLFCSLLGLFIIAVCCVGIYEFSEKEPPIVNNSEHVSIPNPTLSETQSLTSPSSPFLHSTIIFLNQNAVWLFALWLICFVFKSTKLVIGIFYLRRIRNYKIQVPSEEWIAKVHAFSTKMGIKKQVSIIQSTLVKVPVALGYFKPIIVLPIGLVLQLPVAQVETILWHELAHIYRRDYFVNILQKVTEAVFFFNPAILWLSTIIREEREACCDDIVLANVPQKGNYLAALVAFHTQKNTNLSLAMGLNLRPNQLINRLRRMVNKENKRLSFVEIIVLFAGLLMLSAFTFIPQVKPGIKNGVVYLKKTISESLISAAVPTQNRPNKQVTKPLMSSNISQQPKQDTLETDTLMKFKSIRFKNSNEDKANREVNIIDGQDNRYHIIVANGQLILVEFNEESVAESEFKKYESILTQIDNLTLQKIKNPSKQYDNGFKPFKKQASGQQKDDLVRVKFSKDSSRYFQKPKKKMPTIDASADKARVLGVIASLVQHKIVANASSVIWFALTDDQLVVNDQKQDSQLHQQLKEKFGIRPNNGLFFGPTKVHGSGVIFERSDL